MTNDIKPESKGLLSWLKRFAEAMEYDHNAWMQDQMQKQAARIKELESQLQALNENASPQNG